MSSAEGGADSNDSMGKMGEDLGRLLSLEAWMRSFIQNQCS